MSGDFSKTTIVEDVPGKNKLGAARNAENTERDHDEKVAPIGNEMASDDWDAMSCVTARSAITKSTFYTAASGYGERSPRPHTLRA